MDLPKKAVTIRFGRVMAQEELSARMSELSPEQYQAIIQLVYSNIEEIGGMIDGPALDALQMKHLAGGLYWTRTLLEKMNSLRKDKPEPKSEPGFLAEI